MGRTAGRIPAHDLGAGLALLVGAFAVFQASPVLRMNDAKYTMLVSEQLLLEQSFDLSPYFWPNVDSRRYPGVRPGETLPRHVRRHGEGLYYWYPPGTPLLSVPIAALFRAAGMPTIREGGRYDFPNEVRAQKFGAALLMALATVVFFASARLLLPVRWSLLVAVAGGFATHVWSIGSRSLQGHAWAVLLLALALLLLLRWETGRGPLRPVLLGTLLSLGFYVRPPAALASAVVFLLVLARDRRAAVVLGLTGAVGLALFVAYSEAHYGQPLPDYYTPSRKASTPKDAPDPARARLRAERRAAGRPRQPKPIAGAGLHFGNVAYGLPANLVSPSRGILVYSPFLLVVGYLLVAHRHRLRHRALLAAVAGVALLNVFVVSLQAEGRSNGYGQRMLTDVAPAFVVLLILALRAALDGHAELRRRLSPGSWRRRRSLELSALALGVALGVLIHGAGAISEAGTRWNQVPVPLGEDLMRVWDWRRPQWLCALFPSLLPRPAAPPDGAS